MLALVAAAYSKPLLDGNDCPTSKPVTTTSTTYQKNGDRWNNMIKITTETVAACKNGIDGTVVTEGTINTYDMSDNTTVCLNTTSEDKPEINIDTNIAFGAKFTKDFKSVIYHNKYTQNRVQTKVYQCVVEGDTETVQTIVNSEETKTIIQTCNNVNNIPCLTKDKQGDWQFECKPLMPYCDDLLAQCLPPNSMTTEIDIRIGRCGMSPFGPVPDYTVPTVDPTTGSGATDKPTGPTGPTVPTSPSDGTTENPVTTTGNSAGVLASFSLIVFALISQIIM